MALWSDLAFWGSFASYRFLTHMSVSAHALFRSDDISERNTAAMLPPWLQCLTITDDLHWLENVQMCFISSRSLAFFQSYLVGDKVYRQ
jgi:hypothetical protein